MLGINTPPGERDGEFGLAAVPGREKDFQVLFARALDYIAAIGGSAVHCLAGKVAPEQRPAAERVFIDNLKWAADLAAAKNITLLIEPINARDRPNYFLNRVEHAADIIAKAASRISACSSISTMCRSSAAICCTGWRSTCRWSAICNARRCRPATSRTRARSITRRCSRRWTGSAIEGWIGAEYRPRGRTEDGLGWAQAIRRGSAH